MSKNTEMHCSVRSFFMKIRMIREVAVFWVFKDKIAILFQNIIRKNYIWKVFRFFQLIWWVGKDDKEFLSGIFKELKYILCFDCYIVYFQFAGCFFYEPWIFEIFFYRDNVFTSAGWEFIANITGSCKKVQAMFSLKINPCFQYIKEVFFGKISGWSCRKRLWWSNLSAFVCPTDYSHSFKRNKFVKWFIWSFLNV